MSNALIVIGREAKRIRKLHPRKHRKWTGYMQEASKKYNAGKIGKRRKAAKKKKTATRHKANKRKVARRVGTMGAVRKRKKRTVHHAAPRKRRRKAHRKVSGTGKRRRSSGSGISTNKILLLGGLALGAYLLLKPKDTQHTVPGAPPLVTTTNPVRNTQANEIVAYAAAGGLALDAIIRLIESLNKKEDSEIQDVYNYTDANGDIPPWAYA